MDNKRKERLTKIAFFFNGFLFLMGGIGLIGEDKIAFGSIQILAGIINLAMLIRFKNETLKDRLNWLILLMNVIVALSVALDYHWAGKQYIQYAWVLAAVMSVVAMVVQWRRAEIGKK